jgi:hypothetical protein
MWKPLLHTPPVFRGVQEYCVRSVDVGIPELDKKLDLMNFPRTSQYFCIATLRKLIIILIF